MSVHDCHSGNSSMSASVCTLVRIRIVQGTGTCVSVCVPDP